MQYRLEITIDFSSMESMELIAMLMVTSVTLPLMALAGGVLFS